MDSLVTCLVGTVGVGVTMVTIPEEEAMDQDGTGEAATVATGVPPPEDIAHPVALTLHQVSNICDLSRAGVFKRSSCTSRLQVYGLTIFLSG